MFVYYTNNADNMFHNSSNRNSLYIMFWNGAGKFIGKHKNDAGERTEVNQLCQSHLSKSNKILVIQHATVDRLHGAQHCYHLPSTDHHPSSTNLMIIGMFFYYYYSKYKPWKMSKLLSHAQIRITHFRKTWAKSVSMIKKKQKKKQGCHVEYGWTKEHVTETNVQTAYPSHSDPPWPHTRRKRHRAGLLPSWQNCGNQLWEMI